MLFGAAPLQGVDAHAPLRTSGPARLPSASTEGIASRGVSRNLPFGHRFARIVPLLMGIPRPTLHLRSKNRAIFHRTGLACAIVVVARWLVWQLRPTRTADVSFKRIDFN